MEEVWPDYILLEKEGITYLSWAKYSLQLIFLDEQAQRQRFLLSLNLKKIPSPIDAPELYEVSKSESGFFIFKPTSECLSITETEDESLSSCCQSGCRGCAWAEEHIYGTKNK